MKLEATPIAGVCIARTEIHTDARGSLARLFCESDLASTLQGRRIVQVNHSVTKLEGTIRGMHYQRPPHAETKFIRCIRGAAWDVAIDLRAGSSTFLAWHAIEITPENALMLVIPEGCAHGFQALRSGTELLYLHTHAYSPDAEEGVAWNDPAVGIRWPLVPPAHDGLSDRDRSFARMTSSFPKLRV